MRGAVRLARTQVERTEVAKTRIKSAALELFGEQGYESVTLAAISLKAGYSRALAQYHYPDKTLLAAELLAERIRRDNHLELLAVADGLRPDEAWERLRVHFQEVKQYYGALHGRSSRSSALRGEMALHHAAVMSDDPIILDLVREMTRELISRFNRLLDICVKGRLLKHDTDVPALAVLHVHAIWGLALALFANPKGAKQIAGAFDQHWRMMEMLRR